MTVTETETNLKEGRVVGIAGPVIDVEFPRGSLPEINTAVEFTVTVDGKEVRVLAGVAQQLGGGRVRAVCLKPTDGLQRGTPRRAAVDLQAGEPPPGGEALDLESLLPPYDEKVPGRAGGDPNVALFGPADGHPVAVDVVGAAEAAHFPFDLHAALGRDHPVEPFSLLGVDQIGTWGVRPTL